MSSGSPIRSNLLVLLHHINYWPLKHIWIIPISRMKSLKALIIGGVFNVPPFLSELLHTFLKSLIHIHDPDRPLDQPRMVFHFSWRVAKLGWLYTQVICTVSMKLPLEILVSIRLLHMCSIMTCASLVHQWARPLEILLGSMYISCSIWTPHWAFSHPRLIFCFHEKYN